MCDYNSATHSFNCIYRIVTHSVSADHLQVFKGGHNIWAKAIMAVGNYMGDFFGVKIIHLMNCEGRFEPFTHCLSDAAYL